MAAAFGDPRCAVVLYPPGEHRAMSGPATAAVIALMTLGLAQLPLGGGSGRAPAAPPSGPTIVDKPISFTAERKRLTIEYRQIHQDPKSDDIAIEPKMIVLHYTNGGSATNTWRYFNHTVLESGRRKLRGAGAVNVSAHFLVDRDGTIYRLMPETWMARHCIGLNHISIGVENVGDGDKFPLTPAQVEADAALVRHLVGKYDITHLIAHSESRAMEGHPYFLERDPTYRNRKSDPGAEFMRKVRAKVADLGLEGAPE